MLNLTISTDKLTGFSAYVDQTTGDAYLSDSLISIISEMHHETLNKIIQSEGVRNFANEATQVLTEGGVQGVRGLRIASDLKHIIRAWKPRTKLNKDRKEKLIDALMDAGANAFVYSLCGYKMQPVEPRMAAKKIYNYLPAQKQCRDLLKEHGAIGSTYAKVEKYNNDLNGLPCGSRHAVTKDQGIGLTLNYMAASIELLQREKGFARHPNHVANTATKAMREEIYAQFGEDSVPEFLKPKHERKQLKSA